LISLLLGRKGPGSVEGRECTRGSSYGLTSIGTPLLREGNKREKLLSEKKKGTESEAFEGLLRHLLFEGRVNESRVTVYKNVLACKAKCSAKFR